MSTAKQAIAKEYNAVAGRLGQLALDESRLRKERKALVGRLEALQQQHDAIDLAERAEKQQQEKVADGAAD